MEQQEQQEQQYAKRFNNGYLLAQHEPDRRRSLIFVWG
jgi:hypothetical protein